MGLLSEIITSFLYRKKPINSERNNFIFYKIVDSVPEKRRYTLQCINTSAIFQAILTDIVFDLDLLYGLHPVQACYIGIEYDRYLHTEKNVVANKFKGDISKYPARRYGNYYLCYHDRKGNVCFIDESTNKEFIMDPRDIALSRELIQQFDASQAFYIGLLAGRKLHNPVEEHNESKEFIMRRHLRIIK